MNESITTKDKKYICLECKNENEAEGSVGDVIECSFCGIEYEIQSEENGEFVLQLIEEEK